MATRLLLVLCAILLPAIARAQSPAAGVGFVRLATAGVDSVPVAVWYPSEQPVDAWQAGPYAIHATRGASIAPGPHGLILLSHGSGGSEFGHVDLAEALARRGYVVAAPRHLGDSYDRPDGRGTDRQMIGRALQAVASLGAVLADPRIGPTIDPGRIGMAGFSAGGYTALVMAGAIPDFGLIAEHCRAHQDDREICEAAAGARPSEPRPNARLPVGARVRAVVLMAPFGVAFDSAGLKDVTLPVLIYEARDDRVLPNAWNAGHVANALPGHPATRTVDGGHYVFLAPCTDALRSALPTLCDDPAGVDRAAIHAMIDREIGDFFDRELR